MFAVFLAQSATWNTWKFLSLSQTLLLPSSGVKWCNTPDYCKSEGPNKETSWLIAAPVVMFRCKVIICRHLVIDPGDPVSESDPNCFLTCLWIRKLKRHFLHIYVDFFFFLLTLRASRVLRSQVSVVLPAILRSQRLKNSMFIYALLKTSGGLNTINAAPTVIYTRYINHWSYIRSY